MAENQGGKPPGKAQVPPSNEAGQFGLDDRGNVTWEWQDDHDLMADDTLGTAERLRVLVDQTMQIKEVEQDPDNPTQVNPKGLKSGYNPYNSGALGKKDWRRKRNLKELSKWIELRKKMEAKKDEE